MQAQLRPNLAKERDGKSATPSDSHRVSRDVVPGVGAVVAGRERCARRVQLGRRTRRAGSAVEVVAHQLGAPVPFLGQVADGGGRWRDLDRAPVGPDLAGEQARRSVVLPTPFGPIRPIVSPPATVRSTESSTTTGPHVTVIARVHGAVRHRT